MHLSLSCVLRNIGLIEKVSSLCVRLYKPRNMNRLSSSAVLFFSLISYRFQHAAATFKYFAGYEPQTNVTTPALIDLDVEDIVSGLGGTCGASCLLNDCSVDTVAASGNGCNYDGPTVPWPYEPGDHGAFDVWTNGKNSLKSNNVMLTIRGFVSEAKTKASGNSPSTQDVDYTDNKFIAIMNKYWKSKNLDEHTWGEDMILAAFEGTKVGSNTHLDFSTVGRDFRKEAIQKGIVYTNIFPYVIWEMQDAVNDCNAEKYIDAVHAWDTAVALYAGSKTRGKGYGIHGPDGGNLQYRLADKRCINFKTCADGFAGTAQVNQDIFALFNLGKEIAESDCAALNSLAEKIGTLALIPFLQGTLRYLWSTKIGQTAKDAGELWAFATAILPFVAEADANAAEMLYRRAWQLDFTSNSYEEIKSALEATYPKLGAGAGFGLVTCEAVGDLYNGPSDAQRISTRACSSTSRPEASIDLRLVGGLTFLAFALTALSAYTCFLKRRAEKKYNTAVFQGMGIGTGPQA